MDVTDFTVSNGGFRGVTRELNLGFGAVRLMK